MKLDILNRAVGVKAVLVGVFAIVWISWFSYKHGADEVSGATFLFIVLSVLGMFLALICLLGAAKAVRSTTSVKHYLLCIAAGIAVVPLWIAMPMPFGILVPFGFLLIVYGLGGYFGYNRRRPGA